MLSVLALAAPVALAQDDEVFVDPGSPSGKEYALPVDSARKQAAKDGRKRSSKTQAAPLFGEGVGGGSDDAKASGSAGASGSRDDGDSDGGSTGQTGGSGADSAQAGAATLKAQATSPDGGSGLAAVLGVGAGVLALGAGIGLLLRRRSSRAV